MNKIKLTLRITSSPIILLGVLCVTTIGALLMVGTWIVKGGKVLPE